MNRIGTHWHRENSSIGANKKILSFLLYCTVTIKKVKHIPEQPKLLHAHISLS
jgi:hypothetical protein